jgi:hypothetical protein
MASVREAVMTAHCVLPGGSKIRCDSGATLCYCYYVPDLRKGVTRTYGRPLAGEIGSTDAEGATAPETLRHKNRKGHDTLESGAHAPADGITLSGIRTEGAPHFRPYRLDRGCLVCSIFSSGLAARVREWMRWRPMFAGGGHDRRSTLHSGHRSAQADPAI